MKIAAVTLLPFLMQAVTTIVVGAGDLATSD